MTVRNIDSSTVKRWIEQGEAVLLDVREPAEHAAEKIAGAQLLPLGKVSASTLPDVGGKKVVIHCRSGKRGGMACEKLLAEMPDLDVYNLEGGIASWGAAGFPVQASGTFFLPLDRQVQLSVGLLLIMASVLGYFYSSLFFIMTGLIGCGLTVAGLTGFCGLAMVLARMPWNQAVGGNGTSCCVK